MRTVSPERDSAPPHPNGSLTGKIAPLYLRVFGDRRRERQFLSSVGFFSAFATTRAITHALRTRDTTPSRRLWLGSHKLRRRRQHHHLVGGILLLLGSGYVWLLQLGTGLDRSSPWGSRLTALVYGIGSAITLDEFALWLNLEDVYWSREGRESIDAVVLFGALLSVGGWGAPFFHGLAREATRVFRG